VGLELSQADRQVEGGRTQAPASGRTVRVRQSGGERVGGGALTRHGALKLYYPLTQTCTLAGLLHGHMDHVHTVV
jgi:hypothetical protein